MIMLYNAAPCEGSRYPKCQHVNIFLMSSVILLMSNLILVVCKFMRCYLDTTITTCPASVVLRQGLMQDGDGCDNQ